MNKIKFNAISDYIIKWCLYAIVFAVPFSKSISEFSIALAIALWFIRKILNSDIRLVKTDLNVPVLIFIMTILPSFLNTGYMGLSLKAFFTKHLKYIALYFVMVESLDNREKIRDLLVVALLSVIVITLDGFGQYYYSGVDALHNYPSFKERLYPLPDSTEGFFRGFPTASFPFPNDLSAWILLFIFPIASVAIFDIARKRTRYLMAFVSAGVFYLFFLAKTRGAWVGLIISTVYVAVSKKKAWLIILLIAAIAMPFILKMEMSQYIFGMKSVDDRFFMWDTGLKIFKDHPVLGNGINTFFTRFKEERNDQWKGEKGSYAHNCYLQMASDTGLIGLAGFLWLVFSYFKSALKDSRRIKDAFFAGILWSVSVGVFAFLVHSFFDTNLYSLNLVTLFWFAIGLSQAISRVYLKG